MAVLRVKENNEWKEIQAIKGDKGDKGDPGETTVQLYKGDTEPIDSRVLIWIDTSIPVITGIQLITSDNEQFITSDDEIFILEEA